MDLHLGSLNVESKQMTGNINWLLRINVAMFTFCGEKTPTVSPSSLTATPISANTASL